MPALLVYAAGAILLGVGYRFLKKEWQRVNRELDEHEHAEATRMERPAQTLRRDPKTGVWSER